MMVTGVHYMPFDDVHGYGKTKEELEQEGYILVESIPQPADNGKVPIHYVDIDTNEQFYEYEEPAVSDNDRIAALEKAQGDLLIEIAMLKMGGF